jgi:hypothetical protein
LIRIQLISRKVNVPRARNPNVVLKPFCCQYKGTPDGQESFTKIEYEDKRKELDKVFGHLFQAW